MSARLPVYVPEWRRQDVRAVANGSRRRRRSRWLVDTDEMFSHTFDAAGTYKYYCSIHPRMTGQVVVR